MCSRSVFKMRMQMAHWHGWDNSQLRNELLASQAFGELCCFGQTWVNQPSSTDLFAHQSLSKMANTSATVDGLAKLSNPVSLLLYPIVGMSRYLLRLCFDSWDKQNQQYANASLIECRQYAKTNLASQIAHQAKIIGSQHRTIAELQWEISQLKDHSRKLEDRIDVLLKLLVKVSLCPL